MWKKDQPARNLCFVCLIMFSFLLAGCATTPREIAKEDSLFQISLLNALLLGEYDGFVSVETLKSYGDTGIGTLDTLDGEMIFLDGEVYKAKADGSVEVVDDAVLVPFAVATPFIPDVIVLPIENLSGIEPLKSMLDAYIAETTNDFNRFYVAKIQGTFAQILIRSVPAQQKPYLPLSTIAETQKEYAYELLKGTIVAFRCPDYVEGINLPGWHLHFLSSDASEGGHLLGVTVTQAELQMGDMKHFQVLLPSSSSFATMDIASDRRKETLAIEGSTHP
ncbi:MAG: acetolactate decarboxylase [Sphaerochaetaceae bacterium]